MKRIIGGMPILPLLLGIIPTVAAASVPASTHDMHRHPLTPQQRMQEQRDVQQRMAQQMPPKFRSGYEKMMRHQDEIERQHQSQRMPQQHGERS